MCADEIGDKAKPLEIAEWVKGKKDVDVTDGKTKQFSLKLMNEAEAAFKKAGQTSFLGHPLNFDANRAVICYLGGDIPNGDLYAEKAVEAEEENRKDFQKRVLNSFRNQAQRKAEASKN